MAYPFKEIEKKWQQYWEDNKTNKTDMNSEKENYFHFCMFPYPSGDRLHLGHWFQYSCPDAHARFKRMRGFNVLQPIGYDSFGLPAETYAIKTGVHPAVSTKENIEIFTEQYKGIGGMFDWDHMLNTSDAAYYKWTQWLFLTLYQNGLAYQKKASVNWCKKCQTVIANSEVLADSTHERCGEVVEKKKVKSWFFKITDYAERLLQDLDKVDYPEKTKLMQKHWIGKSEGTIVDFKIVDNSNKFQVFTTRPDTLYGVSYCVLAPESSLVEKIVSEEQKEEVENYQKMVASLSEIDRQSTVKEKTGVFTGAYAINPLNNEQVPIWIADYVLEGYGTGCVMAVPAHDQRDFEFAKKFNLPIKAVIKPKDALDFKAKDLEEAYTEAGIMINSEEFDGLDSEEGKSKITEKLEKNNYGKKHITYRLRDWSFSRQRYWGCPIPVIYCEQCGVVPVPMEDLPVLLPENEDIDFKPKGKAPLETVESFMNTTCPKCGGKARRDGETMDTFVCSSWYFLRYLDPSLTDKPFAKEMADKWLPADSYVGGTEHTTGHLLYARFVTKALHDLGYLEAEEPFQRIIHQGMITRDGTKMSKSKGNAVSPDEFVAEYGTDTFRLYIMFMTNFRDGGDWSDEGINGADRFVNRVWRLVTEYRYENTGTVKVDSKINYRLNYTIKEMTKNLEDFYFNTAISRLMELVNDLYIYLKDQKRFNADYYNLVIKELILLISPFTPHLAEELWQKMGNENSIFDHPWPKYDEKALVLDQQVVTVQINGKVRDNLEVAADLADDDLKELVFKREKVLKYTDGKEIKKIIMINSKRGKMVNIVVK